jgi:hypothetical protein
MDIYFIKPQDLLALSTASFAWRFIKDKRLSRSRILSEYSLHRQEERGGKAVLESNISTGDGAQSRPDDPLACTGWKPRRMKKTKISETPFKPDISKKKGIYSEYKPLDWFLGKI